MPIAHVLQGHVQTPLLSQPMACGKLTSDVANVVRVAADPEALVYAPLGPIPGATQAYVDSSVSIARSISVTVE